MQKRPTMACTAAMIALTVLLSVCPTALAESAAEPVVAAQGLTAMAAQDPHPATFGSVSLIGDKREFSTGDTVRISYSLSDDEGVYYIELGFVAGDVDQDYGGNVHRGLFHTGPYLDNGDSVLTFSFGPKDQQGTWHLAEIRVCDKKGYVTRVLDRDIWRRASAEDTEGAIMTDLSAVSFDVTHVPDPHPATFTSAALVGDRRDFSTGDTVRVSYSLSDADGISYVMPYFIAGDVDSDYGGNVYQSLFSTGVYVDTGDSTLGFSVRPNDPRGLWRLAEIAICDVNGYVTKVLDREVWRGASAEDTEGAVMADLSAVTFNVTHNQGDGPQPTPNYKATKGDNATYKAGSTAGLSFTFDGPAELFSSLNMDGTVVARANYDVASGSTVVTLKSAYLKTLSAGKHVVTANYTDGGSASATFTIAAAEQVGQQQVGQGQQQGTEKPSYKATQGGESSYEQGSDKGVAFSFDGPADKLTSLAVDGKALSSDSYDKASDGAVTLRPTYLDTLSAGSHTLVATYSDGGSASATFTVQAAQQQSESGSASGGSSNQGQATQLVSGAKAPEMSNSSRGYPADVTDEITYTIEQKVPKGASSMRIWVDLDPVLRFTTGNDGVVVSSDGGTVRPVVTMDGQRLTVAVDDATSLQGKTVTVNYRAKLRDGANLTPYLRAGTSWAMVPYQAHTVFNGDESNVLSSKEEVVKFTVGGSSSNNASSGSSSSSTKPTTTTTISTTTPDTADATMFALPVLASSGTLIALGRLLRRWTSK